MHKLYTHRLFFLILIFSSNQLISDEYKVAFGSCLDQKLPQPIWSSIENENIDSFIFLGDNVYGDSPNGKLNKMKLAAACVACQSLDTGPLGALRRAAAARAAGARHQRRR